MDHVRAGTRSIEWDHRDVKSINSVSMIKYEACTEVESKNDGLTSSMHQKTTSSSGICIMRIQII